MFNTPEGALHPREGDGMSAYTKRVGSKVMNPSQFVAVPHGALLWDQFGQPWQMQRDGAGKSEIHGLGPIGGVLPTKEGMLTGMFPFHVFYVYPDPREALEP